jgi:HEAT repeats
VTVPAQSAEQVEPPFAPGPVEELLRLFTRAVRAHQLYLPNNPVYKGAIEAVRAAFPPIWKHTDELTLKFTDVDIRWFGKPVLTENAKGVDSLPWTFFKDGIREVQFTPGFETDELVTLFDILQRVRKASPDEDDLLTMLWGADFAKLRYRYIDLGAEPVTNLGDGGEPPKQPSAAEVQSAVHGAGAGGGADNGIINMQDFDATLYFLDERELSYLRNEIEREYAHDIRQNVTSILYDIYETQATPEVRAEVAELLEYLMLMLLAGGQLRAVAYLLAESQTVVVRAADITSEQKMRLGHLPDRLSAPEPLSQLLQALDESADLPAGAELTELFQQLRAAALGTIFAWLPRLQNARVRPLVEQAADRLASANTGELMKLIVSPDKTVAREAARRAGAMKTAAAVVSLARLLTDSDVSMRQTAVQSLSEIGSAGALQALEKSIEDKDRDVRVAVVKTLGAKAYRGVFARLENYVKSKSLRDADLTERMAFFEAYGALCGDNGVPFLDEILNGKGMFGRREDPEMRACAAIALGRIGTQKAQASLRQAANEKDVVVRNAVNRAMRAGAA